MRIYLSRHLLFSFFVFLYTFLHFVGYLLAALLQQSGIDKTHVLDSYSVLFPVVFLLIFAFFYWVFSRLVKPVEVQFDSKYVSLYVGYALAVTLFAFLIYLSKSGIVLFKEGGYVNRYESNVGLGIVSQLLLFFYFGLAILLWYKNLSLGSNSGGLIHFKGVVLVAVVFSVFVFMLLGGHRQLGFGVFFLLIFFFFQKEYYGVKALVLVFVVSVFLITMAALLRYEDLNSDYGVFFYFTVFLFDGLAPINAYHDIYNDIVIYGEYGFSMAVQQLLSVVPRSIWSDKPLIIMNGGNYYTQYILGRPDLITYSPTMLGEVMLVHGLFFGIFLAPILGLIIAWYDKCASGNSAFSFILISLVPLLAFNLYREGFYVFITRLTLFLFFLFAFKFSADLFIKVFVRFKIR